ncbi:uncharacterized protein LOC135500812 [Lineus longissimus]|uniref:uncharacterized protein LOC135500812 n=1 Tax=Lineus longissimus TaxID=88925 RepID=UPI00315CE14D
MDIKRFRSITHLTRVTALVLKFTKLMKGDKDSRAPIKVKDLIQAENIWLQALQSDIYHQEIQAINGVRVRAPLVRQLRLFLDDNGILRVGGRLQNAPLDYVTKFPALLPRVHDFTGLIVQRAHRIVLHSGIQATTTNIRHSYWIPQIRNVVKSVLRNCVICKKLTGKPFRSPISPPLQSFRVQDAPPFEITGIDFTGHLFVITPTQEKKVYVCLFTCAVTRGIHLEIVNDMSTISFLNAFRRFAARRSLPAKIISDNATTFLSAAEEIKRLEQYMQNNHVTWHFIPKRAPWFGGFWERLIGLTKLSLKKVLGRARVDLDELNTITAEIEATLNDRPITYVSDGEPLTPAHLMHGRLLRTLPRHLEDEDATFQIRENTGQRNLEKRAQRLNQIFKHFRQRWRNEYLTALRERHLQNVKYAPTENAIKVGDIVLVHDDIKKRIDWTLARVTKLVFGNDGFVRSAEIKTKHGTTNRPITKLYPLEVRATEELNIDIDIGKDNSAKPAMQDNIAPNPTQTTRPKRKAAVKANKLVANWLQDSDLD